MATPKQPAPHDDAAARPGGPWREDEKGQGAGLPHERAGPAGDASTKGRPNDQRARTEGAAADIGRHGGKGVVDQPPPDPNTVIVGGIGARDEGAEDPDPADPQAPRNPL